jgi:hypothetical protein
MRVRLASVLALCGLCVTSSAAAFDIQGSSAGPFESVADPTSDKTLLGGFWFDYTDDDHHMKTLAVVARTAPARTIVHYNDKNSDDPFTYFVRQSVVPNTVLERTASVTTSQNCESAGLCRISIGTMSGYTFVLQGFYLSFEGTDHHVDRIAVFESGGVLTIAYNDKNDDDYFGARVEYAWVPNTLIAQTGSDSDTNDSMGFIDGVPAEGEFVIRGFDFDFTSSDHHLNMIGINRMNVMYADWNHDDDYFWRVKWATLRSAPLVSDPIFTDPVVVDPIFTAAP